MTQLPSQIADITVDWLNTALPADVGRVKGFDVQRFGTGVGILGELARLTLDYVDGPGGRQTPGDAGQTVIGEILRQCLVRSHETASDIGISARSTPSMEGLFEGCEVGLGKEPTDGPAGGQTNEKGGNAGAGGGPGQGRGHGAFAHAPLPGHDEDP